MALTPVNRQEEWYKQMINAATGKYLPSITAQDAGKVMTVESDGSWGVENIPSELPSVTSADETKVLTVDSNGDWVAGDAPSGLPSTTSASAGDVLSLNNNKEAVWATPSSGGAVSSVNGKTGNVMLTAEDVGAAEAETVVAVSGATPTITPAPNTIYNCGEVESLTISNPPTGGAYSIVFTSGATPTYLSVDPAIKMPDGFSVEANKRYEINVLNRWAVAGSWAVSE